MDLTNAVTQSTGTTDNDKYLAAELIQTLAIKLVCQSFCEKEKQPKGSGDTAHFVRWERAQVPIATLSEGTPPAFTALSVTEVTVTGRQWGAAMATTDKSEHTIKHNITDIVLKELADVAQRIIDREIQVIWLAGTNVIYGDGSVTALADITSTMVIAEDTIAQAYVTLSDGGAWPRGNPQGGIVLGGAANIAGTAMKEGVKTGAVDSGNLANGQSYVAVAPPQVTAQVRKLTNWVPVHQYTDPKSIYVCETGTWGGLRWVESNFLPKFELLGNTTAAVTTGNSFGTNTPVVTAVNGGGSLISSTPYYWKLVAIDKYRGFREQVSIAHSMTSAAAGNDESFTFNFAGMDSDLSYELYFGTAAADASLLLMADAIEAEDVVTVTAASTSTTTAPANIHGTGASDPATIFPVYIHGQGSTKWLGIQDLQYYTETGGVTDPLHQVRTHGFKFWGNALIPREPLLLKLYVASDFT